MKFDHRGNLYPYQKIELSLKEFEGFFIQPFPENSSRHVIFENYLRFIADFKQEVTNNFSQWINGSFVTNKLNPNDIDFVSIIDADIFAEKEELIESKFRLKSAKTEYQVDAYTVKKYPINHKKRLISQHELVYWNNWFSETKKNRMKKKFPKGFIEINFSENDK